MCILVNQSKYVRTNRNPIEEDISYGGGRRGNFKAGVCGKYAKQSNFCKAKAFRNFPSMLAFIERNIEYKSQEVMHPYKTAVMSHFSADLVIPTQDNCGWFGGCSEVQKDVSCIGEY